MRVSIGILASVLTADLLAQGSVGRPMTVDDALNMVRIDDVLMSPGGEWVFFSKSELAWDENFREPRHQRTRDIEEIKWMQKYVMGIEWKPWERR